MVLEKKRPKSRSNQLCVNLFFDAVQPTKRINFEPTSGDWLGLLGVTRKSQEGQGIKAGGRVTEYALPWRRFSFHSKETNKSQCTGS